VDEHGAAVACVFAGMRNLYVCDTVRTGNTPNV
jgi:hypothetical protein